MRIILNLGNAILMRIQLFDELKISLHFSAEAEKPLRWPSMSRKGNLRVWHPLLVNVIITIIWYLRTKKVKEPRMLVQLFATPWTVAHQAPLSMGFSRQEYWSGYPCPSPGDLPKSGIEPRSPALQGDALTSAPSGKPIWEPKKRVLWDGLVNEGMVNMRPSLKIATLPNKTSDSCRASPHSSVITGLGNCPSLGAYHLLSFL